MIYDKYLENYDFLTEEILHERDLLYQKISNNR